jgi:hypothetical protein
LNALGGIDLIIAQTVLPAELIGATGSKTS